MGVFFKRKQNKKTDELVKQSVPPLWGFIWLVYKRAHLGVSPVAWLAASLLLHGLGDVVIRSVLFRRRITLSLN
jgi:hypothetical protein